jgi:hypothetical protein
MPCAVRLLLSFGILLLIAGLCGQVLIEAWRRISWLAFDPESLKDPPQMPRRGCICIQFVWFALRQIGLRSAQAGLRSSYIA